MGCAALFCHFNSEPLTRYQFNAVLQKALAFCGLGDLHIRAHYFRIGAATVAHGMGILFLISNVWVGGVWMLYLITLGLWHCVLCQALPWIKWYLYLDFTGNHSGDVWIVGDSLVRWAQRPLGVSVPVLWRGRSGARLSDLNSLISSMPANAPSPAVLIVHLGTNDLLSIDVFSVRQSISIFMGELKAQFPDTIIYWSDILPRVFFILAPDPRRPWNSSARSSTGGLGLVVVGLGVRF